MVVIIAKIKKNVTNRLFFKKNENIFINITISLLVCNQFFNIEY